MSQPKAYTLNSNNEPLQVAQYFCSTHCITKSTINEDGVIDIVEPYDVNSVCCECVNTVNGIEAPFDYFNQCDRWRTRYEDGEQNWQEMMKKKRPVSLEAFLLMADVSQLLDEDETLSDFVADDPEHGFYISEANSKPVLFIAHAGFEFIFTSNGDAP